MRTKVELGVRKISLPYYQRAKFQELPPSFEAAYQFPSDHFCLFLRVVRWCHHFSFGATVLIVGAFKNIYVCFNRFFCHI